MIWRDLYAVAVLRLKKIYSHSEADSIATILLEYYSGLKKLNPRNFGDRAEPGKEADVFSALVQLEQNMPIQYVLGETYFYKLLFYVSSDVLIPRPETEELVHMVLENIKGKKNVKILDIGTGSGCIPVSIKKNSTHSLIHALDISEEALDVAKRNAALHQTPIIFFNINFLEKKQWQKLDMYNLIISNPPYIPAREKALMDKNVTQFEPVQALFVPDKQPLLFYEAIAAFAERHLEKNGEIFMETHEDFAENVANLFNENGFEAVLIDDLFRKHRFVRAIRFL